MNKPFSISDAISYAWQVFKVRWPLLLGVMLTIGLFNGLVQFGDIIGRYGLNLSDIDVVLLNIVLSIVGGLILVFLNAGKLKIHSKLSRGEEAEYSEMFQQGHAFLKLMAVSLIIMFLAFIVATMIGIGIILLYFALPGNQSLALAITALVGLVGIAGFIYASLRLQFVSYLIVDRKLGIMDSISKSFAITNGVVLTLFLFNLAIFFLNVVGFLMLIVGLLVTIPVSELAKAYVYNLLAKEHFSLPTPEKSKKSTKTKSSTSNTKKKKTSE